jgi:hypothetical protein
VGGRKIWRIQKRKTAVSKTAEKKIVSETEYKLVVRIPRVVGFSPIVVEPQTVVVPVQAEDVRVAIGVRICVTRQPSHCPSGVQ